MAVNINKVYQKVLALANKEQRGYITPQEFNLFADHAQMEIFEQYFYDLDQFKRRPGNDYADITALIEEKIARFEIYDQQVNVLNSYGDVNLNNDAPDLYKLTMVVLDTPALGDQRIAEKTSHKETRSSYAYSALVANSINNGLTARYTLSNNGNANRLKVWPWSSDAEVRISYIRKPKSPDWAYVISGENALFNPNQSTDFELHLSEENKLVIKILALAGVAIKDVQLAQVATGKEASIVQQQKQ
jgi:hypothetical protein